MIIKFQKLISKYTTKRIAYLITYWTYFILITIPILIIGRLYETIPFMIISTLLVNGIRTYSFGFHLTNGKCLFMTFCLLIIFGYLSKTVPMEWSFLIGLFCMRDIYLKSPLKITVKKKDIRWHEKRIMQIFGLCLFVLSVGIYFNLYIINNSILFSIIMVDLLLFINKDEERV